MHLIIKSLLLHLVFSIHDMKWWASCRPIEYSDRFPSLFHTTVSWLTSERSCMLCKTKCSQSQRGEYYTKENKRFDLKETINQVAGSCSKGIPANKCCQRYMYSVSTVFFSLFATLLHNKTITRAKERAIC